MSLFYMLGLKETTLAERSTMIDSLTGVTKINFLFDGFRASIDVCVKKFINAGINMHSP